MTFLCLHFVEDTLTVIPVCRAAVSDVLPTCVSQRKEQPPSLSVVILCSALSPYRPLEDLHPATGTQ